MLLERSVKKFAGWETLLPVVCCCRMCLSAGMDGPAGGECDRRTTATVRVVAAFGFRPEPTLTPPWDPLGVPSGLNRLRGGLSTLKSVFRCFDDGCIMRSKAVSWIENSYSRKDNNNNY